MTEKDAVETVAAGTGVVIVPMSVARLYPRKDVVQRPVTDLPPTKIGLVWLLDNEDERVQAFIGIVRGRTVNSTRHLSCRLVLTGAFGYWLEGDDTGRSTSDRCPASHPRRGAPPSARRSPSRTTPPPRAGLDRLVFGVPAALAVAFVVWGFVSTDSLATPPARR